MKNSKASLPKLFWFAIIFFVMGIIQIPSTEASAHPFNEGTIRQSGNIVFAVIGDYGSGEQPEADVANLVKSWNPDFIVTVGDNNYPIGAAHSIDENIGRYYHEFIHPYNGKYGAGAASKRFFPALGNHDWMSNGAKPYFQYFSFYNEKGYYEFVQGLIHFFVLDSDPNEPDGIASTSKQARWLKNALAASTSEYKIVVMHHPPYSSGEHGSTSIMQWPYKQWGADAVLSGHDHLYERILVDDLPYFVNGIGGEDIYGFGTVVSGSQLRFNQDFGAMRVEANSAYMKFQAITRAGIVVDEYTLGNSIPIVTSMTRTSSARTGLSSVDYVISFSESVTGVDISDFALSSTNISGASINSMNGSGGIYTASINTGSGDGTLRLDLIDNDSIVNIQGNELGDGGAGNGNFINAEAYTVDKTLPSVANIVRAGPNPSNALNVEFVVTFSEPVINVDIADFLISSTAPNGASIANLYGSENTYTVSVNTGSGDGSLRLDLIDNFSITDLANNRLLNAGSANGNFINGEAYTVDKTVPSVTSIIRASPDPSSSASVDFIVTFSESVDGVDGTDFSLSSTNLSNASISTVNNIDPFYIVTVNTGIGSGSIRLDLSDDDSISDSVGNTPGGAGSGNGNFTSGETYSIDKGTTYITSIVRANANPTSATSVDFVITFSEPVTGVDISDFGISTTNIIDASINAVSGSGNIYTAAVNTGSGDGTLRIDLFDDDSITNINGSQLGNPGLDNGNFVNGETYTIDKIGPNATSIIRGGPNPAGLSTVDFIVTFSESVTGVDASDFTVTTAGISETSINHVNSLDPFYIVTVNTGIGTGTLQLVLTDNDSIADAAGNLLGGTGTDNANFTSGEIFDISKVSTNFPPPTTRGFWLNIPTNDSTPSFSWTTVWGARAYEIMLASDSSFNQVITSQVVNNLSLEIKSPLGDGKYYWHVRAYNANLEPGRFSRTQSFTVDTTPPSAPLLIGPTDNATVSTRPYFHWEELDTATKYHIEVDNNSDFSSPEYNSSKREPSVRMPRLGKGIYFWRVRANDQAKNLGNWSVIFTFKIP